MPNYEFEYVDENGDAHRFEQWIDADKHDSVATMHSPCGQFAATRIWSAAPMHGGMTLKEKTSGTTSYRKEFSSFARAQRADRKKYAEPGTREQVSNELWTGNESFKNVLSAKPAGKAASTP